MEPVIEHCPALLLAGFSFYGNPIHSHAGWTEENEIGRLWKRLMGYLSQASIVPTVSYEIHLEQADTPQTGEWEVFVGFAIESVDDLPLELCAKILPDAEYAVFTLRGTQIHMEEPFMDEWLATSGYEIVTPAYIQRYDERFKGLDRIEESELDMLVPVRRVE